MNLLNKSNRICNNNSSNFKLVFLILILNMLYLASSQDFTVSLNSTFSSSINQYADYIVSTGPNNMLGPFIPNGSIILVTFPP